MKKHDILSVLFLTGAISAAGLTYLGYGLPGIVLYTVCMVGATFMCKLKGAPLQAWIALTVASGFGYVTGDWLHSVLSVCVYLSINLRGFIWQKEIYTKNKWTEPVLMVIAWSTYAASNLLHSNGWEGWTFPAIYAALGTQITWVTVRDRFIITEKMRNGLIEIGAVAPDFSLTNQDGTKVSLSDYKDNREVLLIFVRGDWCPGCHIMLRLYEREREKFQNKNIMLFAIGPDPVGVNKAMVEKLGVEFAVLSDEHIEVSKKYCLDIQEGVGEMEEGVPLPASFLIDKQGIVRYTSRANNAGEFLHPDIIFDVLAKL